MSSLEKLSVVAILPELAAGEQLTNVATTLFLADGTIPQAQMSQYEGKILIEPNAGGTVNIRNISNNTVAAGTRVLISAAQEFFAQPRFPRDLDLSASTPAEIPADDIPNGAWAVSNIFASNDVKAANTDVGLDLQDVIPISPLAQAGAVEIELASPGRIRFKKRGYYLTRINVAVRVLAGGSTNVELRRQINAVPARAEQGQSVDFTGGFPEFIFSVERIVSVSQSALDSNGGNYDLNYTINTQDAAVTFSLGTANIAGSTAGALVITRIGSNAP